MGIVIEITLSISAAIIGPLFLGIGIVFGICLIAIMGFSIYEIVSYDPTDPYEDDKSNYERDIQCLNQNRGKSKYNY